MGEDEVRLKQKALEDRGGGLGWGFEPSTPFQTILNCPRSGQAPWCFSINDKTKD